MAKLEEDPQPSDSQSSALSYPLVCVLQWNVPPEIESSSSWEVCESQLERAAPSEAQPVPDTLSSVLLLQGMEGSPREEVFLGAFQFQPENIIQTFQLQVPEQSCLC